MRSTSLAFTKKIIAAVNFISFFGLTAIAQAQDFGKIEAPAGVEKYNTAAGGIGLILFISTIIKLLTIAAGVWSLFNFVLAGWIYITKAGESKAGEEVGHKMTNTVVGLLIVALAYSITGLVSYLIFGDPSYILKPQLESITP